MEGEVYSETPKPHAVGRIAGKGEHGVGRDGLVLSSEVTSCRSVRNRAGLKARSLHPVCFKDGS